ILRRCSIHSKRNYRNLLSSIIKLRVMKHLNLSPSFLTIQSPSASDSIRPSRTSVCCPPEKVPCTAPNSGTPSSLAKSVSSVTDEKGHFLTTIYAHIDQGKRIGLY